MKVNKLCTFAFAAMAFVACSNEEDLTTVDKGGNVQQGEILNAISISFGNSKAHTTRAAGQNSVGIGTENDVYEAFIFAKEVAPKHTRAKDGDWTVIRVVADNNGHTLSETADVVTDNAQKLPSKSELTKALNSKADDNWKIDSVATFFGVRQGDNVYVIVNDPNLTLAEAADLAHKGVESEKLIKNYTVALQKEYLDGLKYYPESGTVNNPALPKGRYVMAGCQQIPTSPTIPSEGTVTVAVGLDRELAKVNFKAAVTTNSTDAAYGKVEFRAGDGVMVSRIARSASMFTQQTGEWYVPSVNNIVNWPALGNSPETSVLFDGTSTTEIQDWIPGVNAPADFNKLAPAGSVTEYRYTWILKDGSITDRTQPIYLSDIEKGTLYAPVFYTTPNYNKNINGATTIVTQATYIGEGIMHNNKLQSYFNPTLELTLGANIYFTDPEDASVNAASVSNPITSAEMLARIKANNKAFGYKMLGEDEFNKLNDAIPADSDLKGATSTDFTQYKEDMDAFYLASLLVYRSQTPGQAVTDENGKKVYFNDLETGVKATDALLMGEGQTFNIGKSADGTWDAIDTNKFTEDAAKTARLTYFSSKDSFDYITGMKLYYRADVANYIDGVSDMITERNTYYDSKGTIRSLGAKSIDDAIMSASNSMYVSVTINQWKLSSNDIDM